jgi:hypothetical protein
MKKAFHLVANILVFIALATSAHATVGCTIVSQTVGATTAPLFQDPDETSDILRDIPLGDIVRYPDSDFAPSQAEGWLWVRHDITQESIWQSGIFGWTKEENTSICG